MKCQWQRKFATITTDTTTIAITTTTATITTTTTSASLYIPRVFAANTMGVMRPLSVDTATLMSALLYWRMYVSCHDELTAGTLTSAAAEAFTTKSLTDSLYSPLAAWYIWM